MKVHTSNLGIKKMKIGYNISGTNYFLQNEYSTDNDTYF